MAAAPAQASRPRPGDAVVSVGADRLVGAIGLAAFVAFAGTALPLHLLLPAPGGARAAAVPGRRSCCAGSAPNCCRADRCPARGALAHGLVLSAGYQLSIAALLLGTVAATGHTVSPLAVLGAFGASQLAGARAGTERRQPARRRARGRPRGRSASRGWRPPPRSRSRPRSPGCPPSSCGGASLLITRRAARHASRALA